MAKYNIDAAPTTTGELVSLINAKSGDTNVEASIARDGNLIIKNVGGFEGDNIDLGSPDSGRDHKLFRQR